MNAHRVVHDTFITNIVIQAPPSHIFAAYADIRARQEWSAPASDAIVYDAAEFRVGGGDRFRCGPKGDLRFHGALVYHDIVVDQRFVFVESIRTDDGPLSVAMVTWELLPEDGETQVRATTQIISFVGPEMVSAAKSGTRATLSNLATWLSHANAANEG